MNNKTTGVAVGIILIIIAITLGVIQHFGVYDFYGSESNKWYFWVLIGLIGLIGIILAVWSYVKKPMEAPAESAKGTTPSS